MINLDKNRDGWTNYIIPQKKVYVSSSVGNDNNNGAINSPVKTIPKALSMIDSANGTQILLKSNDTWTGGIKLMTSGSSESNLIIFSSYGDGNRPRINCNTVNAFEARNRNNFVIDGIHFSAQDRSGSNSETGIFLWSNKNVLIEDCYIEGFDINILHSPLGVFAENISIRRNIIVDAKARPQGKSQGTYLHQINGLLIEENVVDHNGWNPTLLNHSIYLSHDNKNVTIRGNIISDSSSHGLQQRPGGACEYNFFWKNPIHMSYGMVNGGPQVEGGVTGYILGNVCLRGRSIGTHPRGIGFQIGNIKPNSNVHISENIIAHDTEKGFSAIIFEAGDGAWEHTGVGINDLLVKDNIIYNWTNAAFEVEGSMSPSKTNKDAFRNVRMENNDGRIRESDRSKFVIVSEVKNAQYPDPRVTEKDYTNFILEARKQRKGNWNKQFTAYAAINEIRIGFGLNNIIPSYEESLTMRKATVEAGKMITLTNDVVATWQIPDRPTQTGKECTIRYTLPGVRIIKVTPGIDYELTVVAPKPPMKKASVIAGQTITLTNDVSATWEIPDRPTQTGTNCSITYNIPGVRIIKVNPGADYELTVLPAPVKPPAPANLKVIIGEKDLKLEWDKVDGATYAIYRNGQLVDKSSSETYTYNDRSTSTFHVSALRDELESDLSNPITYVRPKISELTMTFEPPPTITVSKAIRKVTIVYEDGTISEIE